MDFHAVFERYAPHVRRFALFLCGNHALADDITAETFVRAWVAQGKIGQETVKAYLFAIARNLYHDALRHSKRLVPLGDAPVQTRSSVERDYEIRTELSSVMAAIQGLPEVERAVLFMRALDGMPYEEISQVINMSVSNVKVRVHRARLKLMEARATPGHTREAGDKI